MKREPIQYDELARQAASLRFDCFRRDGFAAGSGKGRRKPRTDSKRWLLLTMALNRMRKNEPYKDGAVIVLPYFSVSAE